MSNRQKSYRIALAGITLILVSVFALATTWSGGLEWLTPNKVSAQNADPSVTSESLALIAPGTCDGGNNIDVESTGGTPLAGYASLTAAFAAINAGTHQGVIIIEICASETEPAGSAVLNSTGAGSASYTSINIYPIADGLTITGATVVGKGVIELKGTDNVTIDGDNPNTAGTNRNLTIVNNGTSTNGLASVIRVATAATVVTSADNITVKNLILTGSAAGRNIAAANSTTGSENTSFGIYVGGNGGATATDAPTALSSVTTNTAPTGTTVNAFVADNNAINSCARAVVFNGNVAAVSTGITVSNNTIGGAGANSGAPPYAAPATTVYTKGIWINGTTALNVTGNTVQNILSYVGTLMDGIELVGAIGTGTINIANNNIQTVAQQNTANTNQTAGIVVTNAGAPYTISGNTINNIQGRSGSTTAHNAGVFIGTATPASGIIEKNKISTVYNRNTGTFGAVGININAGSNITVRNNFVWDINQDITGAASFGNCCGVYGLSFVSGTGHKVYHNSVNLTGALFGTPTSGNMSAALFIGSTSQTGMDVRNNIFANTMTGGTTSIAHVSIFLPTNSASAMSLTINNNDYFSGPDPLTQGIAQGGTTAGTGFYLASNFNAGATTPATNLRALTTILGPATNDNASQVVDPQFLSATDLHITAGSPMVNAGDAAVGVTSDIDNQTRVGVPDIGADEPAGITPPPNDIAATAFVVPANGGVVLNGATISPQASFTNVGSATQTGINVQYTITGPGGYTYSNVQVIASLASNASTTVTFAAAPTFTTAGAYVISAAVTTADANAGNDVINGGFTVTNPISGAYTAGGGGNFNSLTNAGGVFDSINSLGMTGNTVVTVQGDLTAETGTIALNQFTSPFTLIIQPSGARTISGSNTTALINLNGADNVTINGLNTGGNSLLIRNTSGTTGAVVLITNDASSNALLSTTIEGGNTSTSSALVFIAAGTTTGNDNNSITNNVIRDRTDVAGVPANAVVSLNASTTATNSNNVVNANRIMNFVNNGFATSSGATSDNWNVNINDFSQNAARAANTFAINTGGMTGTNLISGNSIHGFTTTGTNAALGFLIGNSLNLTISRNRIYDFQTTAGATGTIGGLEFDGATGGSATVNVLNNMVVIAPTVSTAQAIIGIHDFAFAGHTFTGDHNTVYIGGTASGSASSWAMRRGTSAPTTYTARNNLLFNNRTGGTGSHFAYGDQSANTGTFVSNSNFFAGTGATPANFFDYGTSSAGTPVSFATFQAGPPARDAGSTAGLASSFVVTDIFVNAVGNDVHLKPTAGGSILSAGMTLGSVTTDFDADPRPAAPDRGADELIQGVAGNFPTGTFYNALITNGDTIVGNFDVTNTLYIQGGSNINAGAFTVGLGCDATVVPQIASVNYIVGNVRKDFCSTGSFTFPVGTVGNGSALTGEGKEQMEVTPEGFTGEYSPMTATINAGTTFPSSLTVNVVDTWLPNLGQTSSISRYWNVTETGTVNADMLFQYLPEDVYGDEPLYSVFKWDGATTTGQPGSVNAGANQFTATGVTSFSGWAAGVRLVNASEASISGRVTTAGGAGIRNATVRLTGGDLTEPRIVQTGALGSYSFSGLHVGQTYVLEVGAKRFRFSNSTRIFTLQDDLNDVDFTANPNEF